MSIKRIGPSIKNIKAPKRASLKPLGAEQRSDKFIAQKKPNTFSALNRPAQPLVVLIEEKNADKPWWSEKLKKTLPPLSLKPHLLLQSFLGQNSLSDILKSAGSRLDHMSVNLLHEVD